MFAVSATAQVINSKHWKMRRFELPFSGGGKFPSRTLPHLQNAAFFNLEELLPFKLKAH